MRPSFNTSGPCVPGKHYMLSPEPRFRHVMKLIDQEKYFTLHAGRQTGKSTSAQWLVARYNAGDTYRALWVDIQTAREQPEPAAAFRTILNEMDRACRRDLLDLARPTDLEALLRDPATAVMTWLSGVAQASALPLVVLIDEADGLVGAAMVSFLTQLRTGYIDRAKTPFPHSVALIGMRQVRDYAIGMQDRHAVSWLGTTSPFNITAEAATLRAFTKEDVAELLLQHTTQTGQQWEPAATDLIYELSQGHPWLVNAMADQIVNTDVEDRSVAVTPEHVEAAKETIILERRSHIDSLIARLREERVRRILDPMLAGEPAPRDLMDDDVAYCLGLGLLVVRDKELQIANPIYREVLPRTLTWVQQISLHQQTSWYLDAKGALDLGKLMAAWQKFWRKDGHLAAEGFSYREAGPHLMLMAFLQRIVNGGGRIDREYGLGRGALDLLVTWRGEQHAIEVKLRRATDTQGEALEQVSRYLDTVGLKTGWLVLFDLRKSVSWTRKLYVRQKKREGKVIRIVGC